MPKRTPLPPELDAHLDGSDAAERADIEQVWALLGRAAPDATAHDDDAWARLQSRLAAPVHRIDAPAATVPARRSQLRLVRVTAWAAAAAVVLAASVALWNRPVEITAPLGETVAVVLPDGSEATLNSASSLRYRRGFAHLPFVDAADRHVSLQGEAFFDVASETRTFTVETFNAEIAVLGTQFNVRARQGNGERATAVEVTEGRVRVRASGEEVILDAGERSTAQNVNAPTAPAPVAETQAGAWRRGGFAVRNLPLPAVFAEIERRWNVRLETPEKLPESNPVTLFLAQPDGPESVLQDLAAARGLQYRATTDGFVVLPSNR